MLEKKTTELPDH